MEVKVKSKVTEVDINSKNLQLIGLTQMNTHTISIERTFGWSGTHSQLIELLVFDEDLGEVAIKIRSEGVVQNENLQKLIEGVGRLKYSD